MNKIDLLDQAARNAGYASICELVSAKEKPSRIIELMADPLLNPLGCIEKTIVFKLLSDAIQHQIREMPTEELKVACAACLADDLPEITCLLP